MHTYIHKVPLLEPSQKLRFTLSGKLFNFLLSLQTHFLVVHIIINCGFEFQQKTSNNYHLYTLILQQKGQNLCKFSQGISCIHIHCRSRRIHHHSANLHRCVWLCDTMANLTLCYVIVWISGH